MSPVAIVTGAARGIGAATVRALGAAGWSVLAVDIARNDAAVPYPLASEADLAGVVGSVDGAVGRVADVRDSAALADAVTEAESRWGGLDAAVACAGVIAGGAPQWEVPREQEQVVLDVNLGGALNLARASIPALLRRSVPRSGRFLAVSSAAGTRGLPLLAGYCAAKAGVAGLVRALASNSPDPESPPTRSAPARRRRRCSTRPRACTSWRTRRLSPHSSRCDDCWTRPRLRRCSHSWPVPAATRSPAPSSPSTEG